MTAPLLLDPTLSAQKAQDVTAPIEGCGNQPVSGFTFCRKMEGQSTNESLVFITPPVQCAKTTCVYIKVFNPQADTVTSIGVVEGQTRTEIAWRELVGKDQFAPENRGFWPFVYQVTFTDDDGFDRTLVLEGEIRLRVYAKNYLPLANGQDDPYFVWEVLHGGHKVKFTTGGRVFIGRGAGLRPVNEAAKPPTAPIGKAHE